ncbi:MAG: AraC family ligand binding domain-containing protein, partial [Planctomycetota bacterium]
MQGGLEPLGLESLRFEYQSGGIARLPEGHSTGWRSLPGLMFSQVGQGAERLEVAGEAPVEAQVGDLILLPAGVRHKVDVIGGAETRRWVHVHYSLVDRLDLTDGLTLPRRIPPPSGAQVGARIA